jgi:hypothetical protein
LSFLIDGRGNPQSLPVEAAACARNSACTSELITSLFLDLGEVTPGGCLSQGEMHIGEVAVGFAERALKVLLDTIRK